MGRPKGFDRIQVLEKTLPVFWKKGFADTSIQDLEKSTGVNKSGLYSEFKDKNDLYLESLKHFIQKTGTLEILATEPLGWQNIETLLYLGIECKGTKGCFIANSVREISILPAQARAIIGQHLQRVQELILQNLIAAKVKKPEIVADMILTFNSGLALEQNFSESKTIKLRIQAFLDLLKAK